MGSFYDNDEAPSIFDIAMAYENGNGGIIRPKVKKISDTYKSVSDTYKDLSDDEKNLYISILVMHINLMQMLKKQKQ